MRRIVETKAVLHFADLAAQPAYAERKPMAVAAVEVGGIRTFVAVPMLKESNLIGTLATSTPNGPSSATFTGRATLNGVGSYALAVTVHDSSGGDTYGAQTVTAPAGTPTAPLGIRLTNATTIGSGVIAIR